MLYNSFEDLAPTRVEGEDDDDKDYSSDKSLEMLSDDEGKDLI